MERFKRSWRIKEERMKAMFDVMDETPKSAEVLKRAADNAERAITDRKGKSSVSHFVEVGKKIPEIEELKKSTEKEDREWHTDMWVVLKKPVEGYRRFALEIKSSDAEVEFVRNSKEFKDFYPFNLIINSNQKRKDGGIIHDFRSELERVAKNLREAARK